MSDELYQAFLDWQRDTVTLRDESGAVLAVGIRPRTAFEQYDARVRVEDAVRVRHMTSLGLLRRRHGDAVDAFLAQIGAAA